VEFVKTKLVVAMTEFLFSFVIFHYQFQQLPDFCFYTFRSHRSLIIIMYTEITFKIRSFNTNHRPGKLETTLLPPPPATTIFCVQVYLHLWLNNYSLKKINICGGRVNVLNVLVRLFLVIGTQLFQPSRNNY
jgi:hypothetical protein